MSVSILRTDMLSLAGLRDDGRRPHDLRHVRIHMGVVPSVVSSAAGVGGSALIEMGLTVALATVRGPIDCPRRTDELPDKASLHVTLKTAPFSSATDHRRLTNPSSDRKLIEASSMIRRALEAVLLLHLFPRARIEVHIIILADDGSTLAAAINAASIALVDAGIPMKDLIVACSAGYTSSLDSSDTVVDLNYREESLSGSHHQQQATAAQLTVAMLPQRESLVLSQCEARLPSLEAMDSLLKTAASGCRALFQIMQGAVRERAASVFTVRNSRAGAHAHLSFP